MKLKLIGSTFMLAALVAVVVTTFASNNAFAKPNGCTSGGKGTTCCWVPFPDGTLHLVCRDNL